VFWKKKTSSTKEAPVVSAKKEGSYFLGIAFAVGGVVALAMTIAQNYFVGTSLAESANGVMVQGYSSILMDCFTAVLAAGIGISIKQRRWGAFCLTLVPLVLYLSYSMQASVNFGMTERIAKSERVQGEINAERDAVNAQNAATLASQQDTLKDLRRRYDRADDRARNRDLTRSERREASLEKSRLDDAIRVAQIAPALKVVEKSGVLADPQAQIISRWTGIDPEAVSLIQVVAQGVGLVLMKFIGFAFSGYWWPRKPEEVKLEAKKEEPAEPEANEEAELGATVTSLLPAATIDTVEDAASEDEQIAPEVLKPVAAIASRMLDDRDVQKADLKKFLAAATHPAAGSLLRNAEFFNHYKTWSKLNGRVEPVVKSNTMFGILIQDLGVKRTNNGNRFFYPGIALVDLGADEAQGVPQLAAA
jgi:hypothetical protein